MARHFAWGETSCANTVRISPPEVARTAVPSARRRTAMWASRSGQRAVGLTDSSLAPPVWRIIPMARCVPARPTVAVDPETMAELLAGIEEDERALRPLRPGEVVEGVVASVSGDEALVDLGGRSAGVLSLREATGEGTDVAVGDRIVAAVVQPESPDGRVVLSTRRARSRRQWLRMTELEKTGEVVEADVVEANRGGLVVDVGLRGFVPLSQLASGGNLGANERTAVPDALRDYVGKRLPLKGRGADRRPDGPC